MTDRGGGKFHPFEKDHISNDSAKEITEKLISRNITQVQVIFFCQINFE